MKALSQAQFPAFMNDNERVVLKFSAPWCGPCRALTPMMDQISQEFSTIAFAEVNVDENPHLAAQFNVRNIPAVIGFKKGDVQWVKVGLPTPNDLRQTLQSLSA